MNPNDPVYEALSPEQRLKVMRASAMAKLTGQPEPGPEKPEKGWSKAQLAGFTRTLYAMERYPTWVVALLIVEAVQRPDPHSALGGFAPVPEQDLYYGEKRARRREGHSPYIEFGEVIEVDEFPGKKWVAEDVLPAEFQAPPTPTTVQIMRRRWKWSERDKQWERIQELVQEKRVIA